MPLGPTVALVLAAQAAPAAAVPPEAAPPAESCRTPRPDPDNREIVICAERPQGYRIDPDIMEAGRLKRSRSAGRPARTGPGGTRDTSRCAVGPEGCPSAGINMLAAALTAAEMAKRLAKGQPVGSMFVTDPQPNEYQLYLMAKREREAREEEKAAAAVRKANAPQAR